MLAFNNIQIIILTIKRTKKWHKWYWCFERNRYMWKDKQPNICNFYFRLGNHITITTKIEFGSNIGHMHGRQPSAIHNIFVIGLVLILQMDRKREFITAFQQLDWIWCVLGLISLNLYNFLDILVEMFWVVLILKFGSLEISIESIEGDGFVNWGWNLSTIASNFPKNEHMNCSYVSFLYHLLDSWLQWEVLGWKFWVVDH